MNIPELAWKTMKDYLEEEDLKLSPRSTIQTAFQIQLVNTDMLD